MWNPNVFDSYPTFYPHNCAMATFGGSLQNDYNNYFIRPMDSISILQNYYSNVYDLWRGQDLFQSSSCMPHGYSEVPVIEYPEDAGIPGTHNGTMEIIRKRQIYSDEQMLILEEAFKKSEYIEPDQQNSLSQQTGLTMNQIQFWFQNKRNKKKKQPVGTIKSDKLVRKKHGRKLFTVEELLALEKLYKYTMYPPRVGKQRMADKLGIKYVHVDAWFRNRRLKGNQTHLTTTQEKKD